MSERSRSFLWVGVAYAAALAAALACIVAMSAHPLLEAAVADLVATLVVFGFSLALRNSSLYDPYWSVAPPLLGLYWWLEAGRVDDPLGWLVLALVLAWGVRLTANWAYGWRGLSEEDWRYRDLQARTGVWYWPVSLLGLHLMPTVMVFAGCVPLFYVLSSDGGAGLGVWAWAGLVIGVAALALESRADIEQHRFRAEREHPQAVLSTGVWSWCRHPNYLGEIGFWVALGVVAWSQGASWFMGGVGILVMFGLFGVVSIPMIERKLSARPGYASYRQSTRMLLPVGRLAAALDTPLTSVWDLPLRLWHWLFALVIGGSLYTGLAGDISLMETHMLLGYGVLALVLFRLGWAGWGGSYARFRHYTVSPPRMLAHFRGTARPTAHTAPGAAIAIVFVIGAALQAVTGLFTTDDIFTEGPLHGHVSSDLAETMTWIHHRVFWLVLGAIGVHLTAHLVYALRKDMTALAMFSGRKAVDVPPVRARATLALVTAAVAGGLVWGLLSLA